MCGGDRCGKMEQAPKLFTGERNRSRREEANEPMRFFLLRRTEREIKRSGLVHFIGDRVFVGKVDLRTHRRGNPLVALFKLDK